MTLSCSMLEILTCTSRAYSSRVIDIDWSYCTFCYFVSSFYLITDEACYGNSADSAIPHLLYELALQLGLTSYFFCMSCYLQNLCEKTTTVASYVVAMPQFRCLDAAFLVHGYHDIQSCFTHMVIIAKDLLLLYSHFFGGFISNIHKPNCDYSSS